MEEGTTVMFQLGWTPRGLAYGFGYSSPWSLARLVHALGAIAPLAARLLIGSCMGGVVVVIIVYWSGGRPRHQILIHLGWSQT
jgi:hypothetical protein